MLCAMHLRYAQLFLWLPNTAEALESVILYPKLVLTSQSSSNKIIRAFSLLFDTRAIFLRKKIQVTELGVKIKQYTLLFITITNKFF